MFKGNYYFRVYLHDTHTLGSAFAYTDQRFWHSNMISPGWPRSHASRIVSMETGHRHLCLFQLLIIESGILHYFSCTFSIFHMPDTVKWKRDAVGGTLSSICTHSRRKAWRRGWIYAFCRTSEVARIWTVEWIFDGGKSPNLLKRFDLHFRHCHAMHYISTAKINAERLKGGGNYWPINYSNIKNFGWLIRRIAWTVLNWYHQNHAYAVSLISGTGFNKNMCLFTHKPHTKPL